MEDWETKFREQFMRPGAIDMDLQNVIQFLHHQLQKARQEERERAVEIIKDELRDAPLEIQMTKGIIFASIIGRIVDPT